MRSVDVQEEQVVPPSLDRDAIILINRRRFSCLAIAEYICRTRKLSSGLGILSASASYQPKQHSRIDMNKLPISGTPGRQNTLN